MLQFFSPSFLPPFLLSLQYVREAANIRIWLVCAHLAERKEEERKQ